MTAAFTSKPEIFKAVPQACIDNKVRRDFPNSTIGSSLFIAVDGVVLVQVNICVRAFCIELVSELAAGVMAESMAPKPKVDSKYKLLLSIKSGA